MVLTAAYAGDVCPKELEKLLDAWPSSLDHLGEVQRMELKRQARIKLLLQDAHYGPTGSPFQKARGMLQAIGL
jgi:hypothetical protein